MTCAHGRLDNKTAVITGGTSGIGEATAKLFAREGANIAIVGRSEEKGDAIVKDINSFGGKAIFVKCDVSKEEDAKNMVDSVIKEFGQIDILFNNAGIVEFGAVHELEEESWDKILDINLKGVYLCSKYAVRHMQKLKKGSIINTASIAGIVGYPESAAYCASKGGVHNLTKNMALDYAPDGIRVNDICPGVIETPMTVGALGGKEGVSKQAENHPLRRVGTPEDIAYAALFLASDESSFVTGTSIVVDGGFTAK